MKKSVLLVLIENRTENAVKVQQILTDLGCIIKTRLGVHDSDPKECTNYGLLFLELTGTEKENAELKDKLAKIEKVKVKLETLEL